MNGHNIAEDIAYGIGTLNELYPDLHGPLGKSPIFIFEAGPCCGGSQLRTRLLPDCRLADAPTADPALLDALARQLLAATAGPWSPCDGQSIDPSAVRDSPVSAIREILDAQVAFIERLCKRPADQFGASRWGLHCDNVNADYGIYLKLLYPDARFLFLQREPVAAYRCFLDEIGGQSGRNASSTDLATAWASRWSELVVSFEHWHSTVGGLCVDYDSLFTGAAGAIEDHLHVKLHDLDGARRRAEESNGKAELSDEEIRTISRYASSTSASRSEIVCPPQPTNAEVAFETADSDQGSPSRCVVLVPTNRYIEPECEEALRELELRGYAVWRLYGCSAIDSARNRLATRAIDDGFEETLWIDADMAFNPDDVERLRSHDLPVACGIYAKRGGGDLAVSLLPGTREMTFGEGGGLAEVLYAAAGFLHVRRPVYEAIRQRFNLPVCGIASSERAIPFFMPMLEQWNGQFSYLGEDYAFSRRARLCGIKILADTSIRLWHVGPYRYGLEDASHQVPQQAAYRHQTAPRTGASAPASIATPL